MKDNKKVWWRWPENKKTGRVPWFVVLRRLAFIWVMYIGMLIVWFGIAGAYGIKRAISFWKQNM